MNEKCPKTEWRLRHGQHVGPYQPQKLVYLWDPNTMQKYTWPASNNSSMACVSDLVEKIQAYRQFKQPKALPVIKLDSRLWSKRFNMRGANLIVLKWITRDDKTGALVEIPDTAAIAGPKPTSTKEFLDQFGAAQTVSPMTAKEATDDEIKF
jgi:hypothetical protein